MTDTAVNTGNYDYTNCEVLITGGSNGIGLGIASAFAKAGANVSITGTRAKADDYETSLSQFHYLQLDVRDRAAIKAISNKFPRLDVLINNAGATLPGGKNEWLPEIFEESVRINLFSAFELAQACKAQLSDSTLAGGAAIINIASLTSFFGNEIVPGYGAAKAGLVQLSKTLGMSWATLGIRTNAIAAGMIDTRMTHFMQDIPEMNDPVLARTPAGRWGTTEDIANAALFLASEQASFITGQTLTVDGGYSIVG